LIFGFGLVFYILNGNEVSDFWQENY